VLGTMPELAPGDAGTDAEQDPITKAVSIPATTDSFIRPRYYQVEVVLAGRPVRPTIAP
jgi:hypothetical protein